MAATDYDNVTSPLPKLDPHQGKKEATAAVDSTHLDREPDQGSKRKYVNTTILIG